MKAVICVLTNHFLPNHGKTLRVGCLWGHKQRRKMGLHKQVEAELPENVYLAYDGLSFEFPDK